MTFYYLKDNFVINLHCDSLYSIDLRRGVLMKKVIIIGGGISGLTAGIVLQKSGFETHIYEKNPIGGG